MPISPVMVGNLKRYLAKLEEADQDIRDAVQAGDEAWMKRAGKTYVWYIRQARKEWREIDKNLALLLRDANEVKRGQVTDWFESPRNPLW